MSEVQLHEIANWHRQVCPVTDWLVISGDLPMDREEAALKLNEWIEAGVTDIVDVRGEWTDEKLVKELAPHIRYHYLGTHDDGTSQDQAWFDEGLTALHEALQHENAVVMVHCHMGVNRGPSMALAYLIDQGWNPLDALDVIRKARPIAGIIYAEDAITATARQLEANGHELDAVLDKTEQWFRDNEIDIATIIRWIRRAE
jgi:dual specificity phosphatase 3